MLGCALFGEVATGAERQVNNETHWSTAKIVDGSAAKRSIRDAGVEHFE
jgi:hypothetical protein